jgi:glyoxylase-like metal-dependent hydrolase (beta-lactamase superfamily II)
VLVDTGTGGANGVGGALIANLALLGVRPEEIDTILLTHAHPDHIGGLLTAAGTPAYPNATVFLPRGKALTGWRHRHWTTPAIAAGATCCSSAAYWRSARRKFVILMKTSR